MPFFHEIGKLLLIFGVILILLGLFFTFGGKIPYLGKLPGDIIIQRENFHFYFPIVTCILISAALTFIFWIIRILRKWLKSLPLDKLRYIWDWVILCNMWWWKFTIFHIRWVNFVICLFIIFGYIINVTSCNSASSLKYGINTLICPGFKMCLQIGMSELRGKALLKVDGNF